MESDVIHVTEGAQCSAKQALIMTEEVVDIQMFKGHSIIKVSSVLVTGTFQNLPEQWWSQGHGKRHYWHWTAHRKQRVLLVQFACLSIMLDWRKQYFLKYSSMRGIVMNSEPYYFQLKCQLNITNFSLNFYSNSCPSQKLKECVRCYSRYIILSSK